MAIKKNILIEELHKCRSEYAAKMVGVKFNNLYVVSYVGDRLYPKGHYRPIIVCQCKCGGVHTFKADHVKSGWTKSCGCEQAILTSKNMLIHGHKKSGTPRGTAEYSIWQAIKNRCKTNTKYIERGISVCDEWAVSFEVFLRDVGEKPSPLHTLERIKNNLGYFKDNCKWATRAEQANNTRRNKFVCVEGERMTLAQAMRKLGCGRTKIRRIYMEQQNKTN